jgi:hypothetical protein
VTVSSGGQVVTEGDSQKVKFTFTRDGYNGDPLTVEFTYNGDEQIVTFEPNKSEVTFEFAVADDGVYQGSRDAVVELLEGFGYELGAAKSATIVINDDESEPLPIASIGTQRPLRQPAGWKSRSPSAALPWDR